MVRRKSTVFCIYIAVLLVFAAASGDAWAKGKRAAHNNSHHTGWASSPAAKAQGKRRAELVIDASTGQILFASQADLRCYPASLTKMMTLYLTFQAIESGKIRLDTPLSVSANAAAQPPTKLGLRAGQTLRVYDAVMGLITESANDAAMVLAENLGGSAAQFAAMMNQQAHALGMNDTHFENPSGLPDPDQVTTARDMASLGYALIYHYPGYYPYFGRTSFRYAGRVHPNHNHLMASYDGMDGIKTGYIRDSGFNLVASANRDGRRLIGVVFGGSSAKSRDNRMAAILDQSFAKREGGTRRVDASSTANSADVDEARYVALPSKAGAVFSPPRNARASLRPVSSESGASSPGEGGWGIQVGAFSDVGMAKQVLTQISQNLNDLLSQAEPSLQKITMSDDTVVYRARFIGLSQQTARSVCTYMIKHGQSCVVISGL